jgi:hypothetical protein
MPLGRFALYLNVRTNDLAHLRMKAVRKIFAFWGLHQTRP